MTKSTVVLHGHDSPATAHLTFVYPFGRTKCVRREWLERAEKGAARGQFRFVTQTTVRSWNIEYTGRIERDGAEAANAWAETQIAAAGERLWNAPKAGTYVFFAVMIQEPLPDGSGRIGTSYAVLRPYDNADSIVSFKECAHAQLDDAERAIVARIEAHSRQASPTAWALADAAQSAA